MELFVCSQNHESSLTTVKLVCITKVVQEYATFMHAFLFYSHFSTFLTHSTLLVLYSFLFSLSILLQGYRSYLCSVSSVFLCTYRRLDWDNKVKNYLCYLIPHTTKSLIFPHASIQMELITVKFICRFWCFTLCPNDY